MKKLICFVLLLSLLPCLLLSGCGNSSERAWQAGQKALAEEKYDVAITSFQKAGSFQDAERLLLYAQASQDLATGNYENAEAGFRALGDFKDSLLMTDYCRARAQDAVAQAAFSSGDATGAVGAAMEAYALYTALPLFRDSDTRGADCRDQLYARATEWMNAGKFDEAAACFEALGDWQDCDGLQTYCKAAALESRASYVEAAELFSTVPMVLDAASRAENARSQAYQTAVSMKDRGDYESAIGAFTALGEYRDSPSQLDSVTGLLVREQLKAGAYAESLKKLNQLTDLSVFPAVDSASIGNLPAFLDSVVNVWLNAHAHVMSSFFACNLLQPYLEPGGELDTLTRSELEKEDETPLNYGFVYLGSEVKELHTLDDNFIGAKVRGSGSVSGPEGTVETAQEMWILVDSSRGYPLAAAVLPLD